MPKPGFAGSYASCKGLGVMTSKASTLWARGGLTLFGVVSVEGF